MICPDIESTLKGKQWPLSCFGPFKDKKNIPNFIEDVSFEECRFHAYEARQQNSLPIYIQQFTQQVNDAQNKMRSLINLNKDMIDVMITIYDETSAQNQNSFGMKSSAFGGASSPATSSVFGGATSAPSTGGSVFAGGSAFGQSALKQSTFGQQSSVFGASQTPANPFSSAPKSSANIFGNAVSNPTFGGAAFGGQQSSIFGQQNQNQQASAFGTQQPTQASVFGAATQQQQPQGNVFCAAPQQPQPSSMFGANPVQQQASIFGANPTPQPTSIFGASAVQPAQQQSSIFGASAAQPAPQQNSMFGASPMQAATFGGDSMQSDQTDTSGFGLQQNAFGGQSAFSQPPNAQSSAGFGQQPAFAASPFNAQNVASSMEQNVYGQTSAPVTMEPQAQQPLNFSQQQQTSAFGQPQQASVFGVQPTTQSQVNPFTQKAEVTSNGTEYSKMEDLSPEDLAAFKANRFEQGKLPTAPPPRELCTEWGF